MIEKLSEQKNNNLEIFNQHIGWVAGDYTNETMHVEDLLRENNIEILKKRGLKNLEERYLKKLIELNPELFKDKYNNSIENYFIQMTEMEGKDKLPLFWKIKESLDKLVNEFNKELKKEKPDLISLKRIFNKISMLMNGNQTDSYRHTPFPEAEKK